MNFKMKNKKFQYDKFLKEIQKPKVKELCDNKEDEEFKKCL